MYAKGKLVLWVADGKIVPKPDNLLSDKVKHIAVANARTAPYGIAAREVLEQKNLLKKLEKKLVYGESVAQVNQFLTSGVAEAGFTSKSAVLSGAFRSKGEWKELDTTLYSPIFQGVVVIKRKNTATQKVEKFKDFLLSDKAKEILNKFGYEITRK